MTADIFEAMMLLRFDIGYARPVARVYALIAVLGLAACQSDKSAAMLEYMTGVMASSYHACVPIGWEPVPTDNTYLVGAESEIEQPEAWIGAIWMGFIPKSALARPRAQAIYRTLHELEKVGLVEHYQVAGGYHFNLTLRALPYFYDGDPLGSNPLRAEFLCYSEIVPDSIVSVQDSANGETRVKFSWHESPDAPWVNYALRSYSVLLAPTQNPATAIFSKRIGRWRGLRIDISSGNQLVDKSVWPQ